MTAQEIRVLSAGNAPDTASILPGPAREPAAMRETAK